MLILSFGSYLALVDFTGDHGGRQFQEGEALLRAVL